MNAFINCLYDWNYTGRVNLEENDENTDDEVFIRRSSNSNECDDVTAFRLHMLLLFSFY